jgi:hypothetical protein
MTKDGRPSLINDIRLFAGGTYSHLEGQQEAVAYGRRMAWFLNGAGFSLGSFPALYVHFTHEMEPGSALVLVPDRHAEWWHRYVNVGVAAGFPDTSDTAEVAKCGVVDALLAVRPDQTKTIRHADMVVREQGNSLRFLLKRRETKKLTIEIAFNVEPWPHPSYLFISQTDKETGTYREADPIALGCIWRDLTLFVGSDSKTRPT